jgi:hypothetical protein
MLFTRNRRVAGALAVASMVTIALPGGDVRAEPPAHSGVVARDAIDDVPWYPDIEDGLVLLPGPTFDEGCLGEGFPEGDRQVVERPDGAMKITIRHRNVDLSLYESDDPFGFIPQQCGALFDGDPATNPADPIGVGEGSVVQHFTIHPDGSVEIQNWVVGRLVADDGSTSPVRAVARYHVSASGETDFEQLDIVVGG